MKNNKNKIVNFGLGIAFAGFSLATINYFLKQSVVLEEKRVLYWQKRLYDKNIKYFIKLKAFNWEEQLKNRDDFFVYFGKRSNPECLCFVNKLSYIARNRGVNIYYIDTSKKETNPILNKLMQELHIKQTPAFLHVKNGDAIQFKFDQKISAFIDSALQTF